MDKVKKKTPSPAFQEETFSNEMRNGDYEEVRDHCTPHFMSKPAKGCVYRWVFLEDDMWPAPAGAGERRRPFPWASGKLPFSHLDLSFIPLSGGQVEQCSGFIWVINGQADGCDVLQRLCNKTGERMT